MEIKPHEGVGAIRFGMHMVEVRSTLGGEFESFKKSPNSVLQTDAFQDNSIHVFYDKDGGCNAVEFYVPSNPTLNGVGFIGGAFSEVNRWFQENSSMVELEDSGLTDFTNGIAIYASGCVEDPSERVESLLVFRKGYYSE